MLDSIYNMAPTKLKSCFFYDNSKILRLKDLSIDEMVGA